MDEIRRSLAQIEAALKRLDRSVLLRVLRPGVPAGHVRAELGSAGLVATAHVEEVYAWRDGTEASAVATLDDIHLFPGFYLLSVEDAIANYRAFVTDPRWTPGWLPVFANGGGDFYVVDLSAYASSPVRHFRIDESDHPVEFSSLGSMLVTIAQGFERGIFFVDPDGYLQMDDLVFGSLAAELNPQEWWAD